MIKSQLIDTAFFTDKYDEWDPHEGPFKINNKNYKVVEMKQIHSGLIYNVNPIKRKYVCDGLYSSKKRYILSVKTADCIPILIHSKKGVGVIHAGWRGLSKNILSNFFENPRYFERDMKVSIGPHARRCCYEVGEDLKKIFPAYTKRNKNKYYLDMSKYVTDYLKELKLEFEDVNVCTICDENYHSYRETKTKKRQYSFLCL